jgi:hypothetical protein
VQSDTLALESKLSAQRLLQALNKLRSDLFDLVFQVAERLPNYDLISGVTSSSKGTDKDVIVESSKKECPRNLSHSRVHSTY